VIHPILEFIARANHASMKVGTRPSIFITFDEQHKIAIANFPDPVSLAVNDQRTDLGEEQCVVHDTV
jgi:hypothetical protein